MDAFILILAFVLLVAGIVMLNRRAFLIGAVVIVFAVVVFLLRDEIAEGADLDTAPAVLLTL